MSARVLEPPAPYFGRETLAPTGWQPNAPRRRARVWRVRLEFLVETNQGEDVRAALAAVGKRCLTVHGLRAVAAHRGGPGRRSR